MSKCSKCGNELLTGDTHWELGWCNNCYNELYKDDKTYISLDKIRLNIAQQFRDENEKLQDKVADLEEKLKESEKNFVVANNLRKNADEVLLNYKTEKYGLDKTIQELRKVKLSLPEKEWYYKGFENCERQMSSHIANLTLEVKNLKQQLAEKDKEIAYLTKQVKKFNNEAQKYFEDAYCNDFHNQDKISFAVEQLEQLKKLCQEKFNWWENSEWEGDIYDKSDVSNAYFDIEANVDNQIEELKKEMK